MYTRAPNPIWFFNDLVGFPLNDEYYAFFLQNVFPYNFQNIFRDQNGFTEWPNPLEFLPNGSLPDNLYFDDTKVYRIEIRKGPTQDDQLIYEIDNFIPPVSSIVPPEFVSLATDNQISNPQFDMVSFNNSVTYTVAGTYEIAPGWFLALTGTGTTSAVITQIQTITGNQGIVNNPPYALGFVLTGWTTAILYQRFMGNGALWASNASQTGSVSMSITAESTDGVARQLTMSYAPSVGPAQIVVNDTMTVGSYSVLDGAINLDDSTNSDLSASAYVDTVITLPASGSFNLTNVQVIGNGTSGTIPLTLTFEQTTPERQLDQLFHYYANSLIMQPKDSVLTGWNFSLNPWQFTSTGFTTPTNICSYITDQTILYQKTASSVQAGQDTPNTNKALVIQAILPTNQFALIQYIDPKTIAPYWMNNMSSLVRAFIGSSVNSQIQFKMRLIYRSTLPPSISPTEPIASWTGTDPVFSAGWTAIAPLNDPTYTLGLPFKDFSFDKFVLPTATSLTMTLGIVIYITNNMSSAAPADVIDFERISLVPNDFAIETNPITWDESLRQCQYYYEKSYDNFVLPGTADVLSSLIYYQKAIFNGSAAFNIYPSSFSIQFNSVKRAAPSKISIYSPSVGTINAVDVVMFNGAVVAGSATVNISNWINAGTGTKSVIWTPANANSLAVTGNTFASTSAVTGMANIQFTADSRLGV